MYVSAGINTMSDCWLALTSAIMGISCDMATCRCIVNGHGC